MPHVIGRQLIEIEVADAQGAPDLLDRIGDFNRTRLLPTIERVLTEFDQPDTLIRIDRLELRLGTISVDDLEMAAVRLETLLREALSAAITAGAAETSDVAVQVIEAVPAGAALLRALGRYLQDGTWPYRQGVAADPMALLGSLIERDPDGVRRLIADAAAEPDAAERLALQLSAGDLHRLIALRAPGRARIPSHASGDRSDRPHRRRLVQAIADTMDPADDIDAGSLAPANPLAELDAFLNHGAITRHGPDVVLLGLADRQPDALSRLFHQHRRDIAMLRRLAETLAPTTLARLLRVLTPAASDVIVAHMVAVRDLHHQRPVVSLADRSLERLLWFVALRHVLNDAGTQFNRKTFVAFMIAELADAERLSYRTMLRAFATSLANLMGTAPATTALASIILELARSPEPDLSDLTDHPVQPASDDAGSDSPPASDRLAMVGASVATYRNLDRLRHLLASGALPWQDLLDEPALTPATLIDALRSERPGRVLNALRHAHLSPPQIRRALDLMPDATRTALLLLLQPSGRNHPGLTDTADIIASRLESSPGHLRSADDTAPTTIAARHTLSDALDTRLAALAADATKTTTSASDWIDALVQLAEDHPRAARRLLAKVIARGAVWARLLHALGPRQLKALLKALAPMAAAPLIQLTDALTAAGHHHGLQHRVVADAFLTEVIPGGAETTASPAFLQRTLTRLFADGAPDWVADMCKTPPAQLSPQVTDGLQALLMAQRPVTDRNPTGSLAQMQHGAAAGQHTEWLFQALAACDLQRAAPRDAAPELLNELMEALLAQNSRHLAERLLAFLARAPNRRHLIRLLPERQLALLVSRALPHVGPELLDAAELLTEAAGRPLDRAMMWQNLLETASAPANQRTVANLADHLLSAIAQNERTSDPAARTDAIATLARTAARLARDAGHAPLAAALQARSRPPVPRQARPSLAAAPKPARTGAAKSHRGRTTFRLGDDADTAEEPIFIDNAGLVLTNPFLPHLLGTLGLLIRDARGKPRLRDEAAASRAAHLLQYLVDGRTDAPEPLLPLNKVLCGLPIAAPVERAIVMTDDERDICDTLLRSIIGNWPILSGTSIAGLRETFLQREGKLTQTEGVWRLQVQRKTLDVLVDQIPWSIGVVFHAWMPGALHVTW